MEETVTGLDYRALVEARATLHAEAGRRYRHDPARSREDAQCDGAAYQACVTAEHAIFEALNVLASHCHEPEALRVIHMREWEEPS